LSFLPALAFPEIQSVPTPWEELALQDFSGGLCTAFPESSIADNQFTALTNYYVEDNNSLKTRGPYRPYLVATYDTVLTTAPLSFMWIELGATEYLVASRDAGANYEVNYWDTSAWASTAIKSDLTDDYRVEFVKFSVNDQEDLIFCNGKDTPQRWIGSGTSTDLGLTAPSGSGVTATDGPSGSRGVGTGGVYYYKLTYWYESSTTTQYGESNASGVITSNTISVTAGEYSSIDLSGLPALTAGTTTRLYIYRSPVDNQSGPYRRVGYITSGTTFTDDVPEGEAGVELAVDDGTVPLLKHPCAFRGRLWGVGIDSSGGLKNKLVYSAPGCADLFPALNYAYFPDEYIGSKPFKENIYHFTTKQIYVTPQGDVDTYDEPLKICDKGCTSYESIVDVGNGLVFQGEDNMYWVDFNTHSLKDGDYPIPIGEPIKDKIQDIASGYRDNSCACLHDGRYFLSFTSSSSTTNDSTLVWNVKAGTKLLRTTLHR
jgi:hypothetical protein